jgi:hypothetical protein
VLQSGWLQPYLEDIKLLLKSLPGTNTLACYGNLLNADKILSIKWPPGLNCKNYTSLKRLVRGQHILLIF